MSYEVRAFLGLPLAAAKDSLRRTAQAYDAPVEETRTEFAVRLRTGTLRLSEHGGRTALGIAADDAAGLQMLRDLVAEQSADAGVQIDWQDRAGGRRPGNLSVARVASVERISSSYLRVTVEGADLARFGHGGLHFRLILRPAGVDWPTTDAGGVTQWPGGPAAWHRPVYTTRTIELLDGGAARITFDVFRHAGGRVTEWAEQAQPGEEVAMTGPGGDERPTADWMGLIGDETAVPVMARILAESPPETRGEAVLFVPEADDIQDLVHPPGFAVRWVVRGGPEGPLNALDALHPPAGHHLIFLAAERQEAMEARARLQARGFGRGSFLAYAYWSAEEA